MLAQNSTDSKRPKNRKAKNSTVDARYPMAMAAADCLSDSTPSTAPKFMRNSAENTPVPMPYAVTSAVPAVPSLPAPSTSSVHTAMPMGNR